MKIRIPRVYVPPEVLQAKAEEIWEESEGRWGTPPGKPLEGYTAMCKRRGLRERSMSGRAKKRSSAI